MSTRSLTHIHDDDGKPLLTFYRHSDGYPEGHGKYLAEFLDGFNVVNGLSGDEGKTANGMGCLAAQIIAHFKNGPGGIYIYPIGSKGCDEEYVYTVTQGPERDITKGKWPRMAHTVLLTCAEDDGKELFSGTPSGFLAFLAKQNAVES